MNRIRFHELASKELLEVRDYYDDLVYRLGEKFVIEVERCLNVIRTNPLAYPVVKQNVRKAVVIKFPYSILYRVEKNNIYILAVMHQKRKPKYWVERM
ncbi:MAG: type II toxin-antitoxin system RelE/ParE family toxin [Ignavibacteriaceae bacterium]